MTATDPLLRRVVNEQLGAVVFVQNYLQLDFDGIRLTTNVWPVVTIEANEYRFGESGYRDALCSFIAHKVVATSETDAELGINFATGRLAISLLEDISIEHAIAHDTTTDDWSWW
jgi:hypothetical protein